MYKFKQAARRGSALLAAASLLAGISASAIPALVSADALNPLTDRSLTLSSSSPGWSYKDGSGNSTYAPPNSGANGQKTGESFTFKTSTSSALIKGFTFQYCTAAAGQCRAPGDDGWSGTAGSMTRNADSTSTTDLNVATSSPSEITDWATIQARTSGATPGQYAKTPLADNSEGNFIVLVNGTQITGWSMTAGNNETGTVAAGTATGRNNIITLTNSTGDTITAGQTVQVIFFGTNTNYITNPGSSAFFVKINDFDIATNTDTGKTDDGHALDPTQSSHIIDGGVTVANVMNESISIQTKVLETMDFSVGTVDPDTLAPGASSELHTANGNAAHGDCDPIVTGLSPTDPHNVLAMGNKIAENSLETAETYATHSYWRLSSNSSGGATVYYTGHTLTNTEGDQIAPIGTTAAAPLTGSPQFGIGIDNTNDTTVGPSLVDYAGASNTHENGADASVATQGASLDSAFSTLVSTTANNAIVHTPGLYPLVAATQYANGKGGINNADSGGIGTSFAFDANADSSAVPIASETSQVVNCVTGKMRYVANIAATTPAGIYTTKVNYVASPQY